jgi:LysM repeat protein
MKRALENSCIKGCVIYLAILVIILVASAVGFGGLSARFGMSTPAVQGYRTQSGIAPQDAPQATAVNTAQAQAQGTIQGTGSNPIIVFEPQPQQQEQAPAPTATPVPPPPAPAQAPAQPARSQDSYAPQVQAQDGQIQGQASQPFYIVQSGDTLSGIASRFSTTVDALRQANNLDDVNSIWPGQLLYLPQNGQPPSAPQGQTGQPTNGGSATQGGPGSIPSMPNTGINSGR